MENINYDYVFDSKTPIKTLVVLGSGGHTMEMSEIVGNLDRKIYTPRIYVLAKSDKTSKKKINEEGVSFINIFRSRLVNQSYLTSIFTTFLAIFECIPLCYHIQPDLILCNGPGTCVPICLVAFILKLLRITKPCKIVFIESYCRVKSLSLSGKILLRIVDMFVIQWPDLLVETKGRSSVKYFGRLL